jgi:chemotaxis protein CheC
MLTTDQKDALQEIANIGMGQAGEVIAKVLNEFVTLSIPRILILQPNLIAPALQRMVNSELVSAVRQAFHSSFRGEALVLFGLQRCADLADLMGYEDDIDHAAEMEILLDISNILVGACLGGIAKQVGVDIGFSAPSLLADRVPIKEMMKVNDASWQHALLVEVNFQLEQRSFACHLVILMSEHELKKFAGELDRFLESL